MRALIVFMLNLYLKYFNCTLSITSTFPIRILWKFNITMFLHLLWSLSSVKLSLRFGVFILNEPRHEKACLCHMRTTQAQISLRISTSSYIRNFKTLVSFCRQTGRFVLPGRKPRRPVFSWRGSKVCQKQKWTTTWKNQQNECAPSEDCPAWSETSLCAQ